MTTETSEPKRTLQWSALIIALLLLIALPPFLPRGNPYASVIGDIAAASEWDADSVQMLRGRNTDISFLRWTEVDIVVRSASSEAPVFATLRKGPLSRARISCYSVGSADPCAE